jgi:hypothetical protein
MAISRSAAIMTSMVNSLSKGTLVLFENPALNKPVNVVKKFDKIIIERNPGIGPYRDLDNRLKNGNEIKAIAGILAEQQGYEQRCYIGTNVYVDFFDNKSGPGPCSGIPKQINSQNYEPQIKLTILRCQTFLHQIVTLNILAADHQLDIRNIYLNLKSPELVANFNIDIDKMELDLKDCPFWTTALMLMTSERLFQLSAYLIYSDVPSRVEILAKMPPLTKELLLKFLAVTTIYAPEIDPAGVDFRTKYMTPQKYDHALESMYKFFGKNKYFYPKMVTIGEKEKGSLITAFEVIDKYPTNMPFKVQDECRTAAVHELLCALDTFCSIQTIDVSRYIEEAFVFSCLIEATFGKEPERDTVLASLAHQCKDLGLLPALGFIESQMDL